MDPASCLADETCIAGLDDVLSSEKQSKVDLSDYIYVRSAEFDYCVLTARGFLYGLRGLENATLEPGGWQVRHRHRV